MLKKKMERLETTLDEDTINGLSRLYESNTYTLYDDALPAVKEAKDMQLKTAIATTPPRFWYEKDMQAVLDHIDFLCTGDVTGCEKSNPKMYQTILAHFDVKPEEAVVIGDGHYVDILLPDSLGMKTVYLDRGSSEDINSVAGATVNTLYEALDEVRSFLSWSLIHPSFILIVGTVFCDYLWDLRYSTWMKTA